MELSRINELMTSSSSDYGSTQGQFNTLSSDFCKIWE